MKKKQAKALDGILNKFTPKCHSATVNDKELPLCNMLEGLGYIEVVCHHVATSAADLWKYFRGYPFFECFCTFKLRTKNESINTRKVVRFKISLVVLWDNTRKTL